MKIQYQLINEKDYQGKNTIIQPPIWKSNNFKQFWLLMWKNFKLQIRHPWITMLELVLPIIFCILLGSVRSFSLAQPEYITNPTIFKPFSISSGVYGRAYNMVTNSTTILYAPNNTFIQEIMRRVSHKLSCNNVIGFENEDSLLRYYSKLIAEENDVLAAIIFDSKLENSTNFTPKIVYRIRPKAVLKEYTNILDIGDWRTNFRYDFAAKKIGPRERKKNMGGSPGYMHRGFLPVQHVIDLSIIELISPDFQEKELEFDVKLQRFPYPPYKLDMFLIYLSFFLPMTAILAYMYPFVDIVKNIVLEKERRLKEAMKIMGLNYSLNWIAWFAKYMIFLGIITLLITLVLTAKVSENTAVFPHSDPIVLYIAIMTYCASTLCFSFLLSTCFSKANIGAVVSAIIYGLSITPYILVFRAYGSMTFFYKLLCCIPTNSAFCLGTLLVISLENSGVGIQWNTILQSPSPDDDMTLGWIFIMLVIDGIAALILTWYIGNAFPGTYGVPEVWYFPFTRSYWFGTSQKNSCQQRANDLNKIEPNSFEEEPVNLSPGIQVRGLTKMYKKGIIPAVSNININMYRSQITVLLGHNGAGKTTTISMITGLFPPTMGDIFINGVNVRTNKNQASSCFGYCPQYDILMDDLNVEEHLYFFASLKLYPSELIPAEITRMIMAVGLTDKRYALAQHLSGGMKRKLSLAIAFIGESEVVLLDEPTSGLDPSSRRFIWDLIQSEKQERTILLTTHYMDEADVLGDRIAIMVDGIIQCCGSSLFLKQKFGHGYRLTLVKDANCKVSNISSLVKYHVPLAKLDKNIGTELSYVLPYESAQQFENLFFELEMRQQDLKISSFGASITTMEEIFINVGEYAASKYAITIVDGDFSDSSTTTASENSDSYNTEPTEEVVLRGNDFIKDDQHSPVENPGHNLFWQQFGTLLVKRQIFIKRNWMIYFCLYIWGPIHLSFDILFSRPLNDLQNSPPLPLNLDVFHNTTVFEVLNSNETDDIKLSQIFSSQFDQLKNKVEEVHNANSSAYLLQQENDEDMENFNRHNIIGLQVASDEHNNKTFLTGLFNNDALHSPAISLWSIDNTLLKYFTNTSNSLTTINHPLPWTVGEKSHGFETILHIMDSALLSDGFLSLGVFVAGLIIFLIQEKTVVSKHLQQISGANLFTFWLSNFVWDFTCFFTAGLLFIPLLFYFKTGGMTSPDAIGRIILILALAGFATIFTSYCVSFFFTEPATGFVGVAVFLVIVSQNAIMYVSILEIPQLQLKNYSYILDGMSHVLPTYCMGRALSNLYVNYQFTSICNHTWMQLACDLPMPISMKVCCPGRCGNYCIPWEKDLYSFNTPGIGKELLMSAVLGICFLILLTAIEMKYFRYLIYFFKSCGGSNRSYANITEDEDVIKERKYILTTPMDALYSSNHLILKQTSKHYGNLVAVDKLSFSTKIGECFGLLGLNGAGKTTTFKMITGETPVTSGNIYLDGYSVRTNIRQVQQRLGYCPQFDALIDSFTGRETLNLFCNLRGLSKYSIPVEIKKLSSLLSFEAHINKQVKEYSGGNKRKLSVAIALIGNPPIIFLDEPTTGMDPVSRRKMWKIFLNILKNGRSIVLTSHSMEECEVLCSRIGIMVNGKLCCLGSPQHLKNKYGQGFFVIIKVGRSKSNEYQKNCSTDSFVNGIVIDSPEPHFENEEERFQHDMKQVKNFIESTFINCELKEVHQNFLYYHILKSTCTWSQIFGILEKAKLQLNIVDYSVGQTTLEQVFLNFARMQRNDDM